jgi:hypothetical protein
MPTLEIGLEHRPFGPTHAAYGYIRRRITIRPIARMVINMRCARQPRSPKMIRSAGAVFAHGPIVRDA